MSDRGHPTTYLRVTHDEYGNMFMEAGCNAEVLGRGCGWRVPVARANLVVGINSDEVRALDRQHLEHAAKESP